MHRSQIEQEKNVLLLLHSPGRTGRSVPCHDYCPQTTGSGVYIYTQARLMTTATTVRQEDWPGSRHSPRITINQRWAGWWLNGALHFACRVIRSLKFVLCVGPVRLTNALFGFRGESADVSRANRRRLGLKSSSIRCAIFRQPVFMAT